MTIPESVRALIEAGPPAYLTTLNTDGSPQVTLVWAGIENDEVVIPHMKVWHKVKNMRRDSRVALAQPVPYQKGAPGYIMRITPDRFTGVGSWTPTTVWPKPSTFVD